jgi:uncharacterized protein YggE
MIKTLLIASMLSLVTSTVSASQLPEYPFIHAVGNAKIYVQPDIGEISFDVTVSDADSEKATQQTAAINDDILKLLAEQNIPASDISIYELEKKMRVIESTDGKPATVIYDIKQGMTITVKDLSKWQNLTTPLLVKDHLGNFDANFDLTNRQQLKESLMQDAIKNAQHNGTIMVEAFGKHLGMVMAVSSEKLHDVGSALGIVRGSSYDDEERRGNAVRNFSAPQALMIVQSVDVLFKIK